MSQKKTFIAAAFFSILVFCLTITSRDFDVESESPARSQPPQPSSKSSAPSSSRPPLPPPPPRDVVTLKQNLFAAGYRDNKLIKVVNQSTVYFTGYPVQNELLWGIGQDADTHALIQSINQCITDLDKDIIGYYNNLNEYGREMFLSRNKAGTGLTGRGWGITSPFTNKWKYYVRHLMNVKAKNVCEVGFLAGHSAAVFVGTLRHIGVTIESVTEFDMVQRHTFWHHPATAFFHKSEILGDRFQMHVGMSCPKGRNATATGALRKCDYISLDGGKMVDQVLCDLYNFFSVRNEEVPTVILTDDVNPGHVKAAVHASTKNALKDHHDLLGYLLKTKALDLVDCFESDVQGWPAYGVCAFRYGVTFADVFEQLRSQYLPPSKMR